MTTFGFIGSGHIGSHIARTAIAHGHDVVLSNSRGPETLADLVAELGEHARAATASEAAAAGDIVVVAIPTKNEDTVPVAETAGKLVIDADNYYPQRDGQIAELDAETATSAELLQRRLPTSRVVKAFNHLRASDIIDSATPAGTPGRRALVISADDEAARAEAIALLDEFGFDAVDIGPLSESWRIQPGTPGYGADLTQAELQAAVESAVRPTPSA